MRAEVRPTLHLKRNISHLLTQLQGFGETPSPHEHAQVQLPHSSPETDLLLDDTNEQTLFEADKTEAERAKESREQQAKQMRDRCDFTPFIQEGVDMNTTYEQGVQYMYSIFNYFFSLPADDIDKRPWTNENGKICDSRLHYLLQDMGLSMSRASIST